MGIIPALAGNTPSSASEPVCSWDYPRACGEHPVWPRWTRCPRGSSPRLRGTQVRHVSDQWRAGIIPALAGSTSSSRCGTASSRDHPRACGEHGHAEVWARFKRGSSPRLRGTLGGVHRFGRGRGIIPALAGNTNALPSARVIYRDHPRACGEHITPNPLANALLGSSPRLRGTLLRHLPSPSAHGIIPALAGNTRSLRRLSL